MDKKINEIDLHDVFVKELIEKKSLGSLYYLINAGRELEFTVNEESCFLSRSGSAKFVSLWVGSDEQSFDNMEELLESSMINGCPFLSIWEKAKIVFLF